MTICIRCKAPIQDNAVNEGFDILISGTPQPEKLHSKLSNILEDPRWQMSRIGKVQEALCIRCGRGILALNFGMLPGFMPWTINNRDDVLLAVLLMAGDINPLRVHPNFEDARRGNTRKEALTVELQHPDSYPQHGSRKQPEWAFLAFTLGEAMRAAKNHMPPTDRPNLTLETITWDELKHWWNGHSPRTLRKLYGFNLPLLRGDERLPQPAHVPRGWGSFEPQFQPSQQATPLPISPQQPSLARSPESPRSAYPLSSEAPPSPAGSMKFGGSLRCRICGGFINMDTMQCVNGPHTP